MFAEDPFNVEIRRKSRKVQGEFRNCMGGKTCKCLLNPGILES